MHFGNLFADIPTALPEELFEAIPIAAAGLRLERIVSRDHATPEGQWYDQELAEWVLLIKGMAGLRFEHEPAIHILRPGDWLEIPAHCRHRVEWTHPQQDTVWLALHYPAAVEPGGES